MRALNRRAGRAMAVTVGVLATAGTAAMAAGDAPRAVPDGDGWTFEADAEGWATPEDGTSCLILSNVEDPFGLCETTNSHDAEEKALATRFEPVANAAGVFEGRGVWASPSFTVDVPEVGTATLSYRRKAVVDQLIAESGSRLRADVVAVDEAAKVEILLSREELTADDTEAWQRRTRSLGTSALEPGKTYHLLVKTYATTDDAQLLVGEVSALYDDIKLTVSPPAADGEKGEPGVQGPAGPAGPAGPTPEPVVVHAPAAPADGGGREASVNSDAARRLLRIDRLQPLHARGAFRGQLRTRIFCRPAAGLRCEGTVKIRTIKRVNTAFLKGRKVLRRVTLGTGAYRLNKGQTGYAKIITTPLSSKIIRTRGPLAVEVLVTVLDENGRQQTLRREFTLRTRR